MQPPALLPQRGSTPLFKDLVKLGSRQTQEKDVHTQGASIWGHPQAEEEAAAGTQGPTTHNGTQWELGLS